jgi:hypothetical protein
MIRLNQLSCVGIHAKAATKWSVLYTGLPQAIVGAPNLDYKFKPSPDDIN